MRTAPLLLSALVFFGAASAALAGSAGRQREPARMTIGDPAGQHVNIVVARDGRASRALVIQTRRVGAPGSRLRLSVDRGRPLVSAILDDDQCRFDDDGSLCTISFGAGSAEYRRLVAAIRRGRTAHVEIENAGNMAMSRDVSLAGFARALGPAKR